MPAQRNQQEIAMADATTPDVRKAGGWVIVWGILLIVAGVLAVLSPPMAALAAFDFRSTGRVHRVTMICIAVMVIFFPRVLLIENEAWVSVGRALLRPFL